MPRHFALVPAAGSGARFGSEIPKQYLPLAGRPMIHHALAALCRCERIDRVWVVLSPGDAWWEAYDWSSLGAKLEVLRCGGATRISWWSSRRTSSVTWSAACNRKSFSRRMRRTRRRRVGR